MTDRRSFRACSGWVDLALDRLAAAGVEVFAPRQDEKGSVELTPVTSAEEMTLDYLNVRLPVKRLFFPMSEVLVEYQNRERGDIGVLPQQFASEGERVVLGCRPCDAAALAVLDKVFQWDYEDVPYRVRRDATTVVSYACSKPDGQCFCTSVGGSPHGTQGSDALVFMEEGGGALIQVITEKGERFAERLGDAVQPAPPESEPPAVPDVPQRVEPARLKAWLDDNFENDFWQDISLRCVGCGTCTYLCPTCHCFDIVDEGTWNQGRRLRNWDSCSYGLFTLHGSGHNPRPDQAARYRQRIMHKFKYFPEKFGLIACVGCGRCMRFCGVGQNLLNILMDIQSK